MKHSVPGLVSCVLVILAAFVSIMAYALLRFTLGFDGIMRETVLAMLFKVPNVIFIGALIAGIIGLFSKNTIRTTAVIGVSISGYALFRALMSWLTAVLSQAVLYHL